MVVPGAVLPHCWAAGVHMVWRPFLFLHRMINALRASAAGRITRAHYRRLSFSPVSGLALQLYGWSPSQVLRMAALRELGGRAERLYICWHVYTRSTLPADRPPRCMGPNHVPARCRVHPRTRDALRPPGPRRGRRCRHRGCERRFTYAREAAVLLLRSRGRCGAAGSVIRSITVEAPCVRPR